MPRSPSEQRKDMCCCYSIFRTNTDLRHGRDMYQGMTSVVPSSLQAALDDKNSIRALAPAAISAWSTSTLKPLSTCARASVTRFFYSIRRYFHENSRSNDSRSSLLSFD